MCLDGACVVCEPESAECRGNSPGLCNGAGSAWFAPSECAGETPACFDSICVVCSPGQTRCSSTSIEQCNGEGSGWEFTAECTGDTPVCEDASCRPLCVFEDADLAAVISETMVDEGAVIDAADVAKLTELDASELEIESLQGIECLTSLTELLLFKNQIVDLSPLSELPNLIFLDLWSNQVVDVTPLASITTLEKLWLNGNLIVDASPLTALAGLTSLRLNSNKLVGIDGLNLTNLEYFRLDPNTEFDCTGQAANLLTYTNLPSMIDFQNPCD